jgi:hypothetical protein
MAGDHQSIVISINAFIQVGLASANRTTCVRCAKRLADYSNFFCGFRKLGYRKCTRYSILGQICEPVSNSHTLKFDYG